MANAILMSGGVFAVTSDDVTAKRESMSCRVIQR